MIYEMKEAYIECCKRILEGISKDENLDFKRSLPICILDAVFSIGARYSSTRNVWKRYLNYYNLELKTFAEIGNGGTDKSEHTISDFLHNAEQFDDVEAFASEVLKNRQRTSPRNGILKAQASLEVARIMKLNNIDTVGDFQNFKDKEKLNKQICSVRGERSGIMLRYLYMLAGDANLCKPDRWIERFIHNYYPDIQFEDIQSLISQTVLVLQKERPEITVRMLDNAIWKYQTKK